MAKTYTPAQIRAAQAQRRELSLMAFEHFCMSQRDRVLRTLTGTETDKDLPIDQVEATWRRQRLGTSLTVFESMDNGALDCEVRK